MELCWTAAEDGLVPLDRDRLPEQLLCFLPHPIEPNGASQQETLDVMIQQGLLLASGRRVHLSPAGERAAQTIVRRHRLAEVLLSNVLHVSETSMESTACQVEHILNPEVTEAVCAFLGHPPSCPHGRAIPRDSCCQAARATLEPLIVPLAHLAMGEEATIAFVHSARQTYLQRLSAFGVAPGCRLRLRQTKPSLVVRIGETELALDRQAGEEIFVKRLPRQTPHPSAFPSQNPQT